MKKHYGDYTDAELSKLSLEELVRIIKETQMDDNFIIMSDSYKMTHHFFLPEGVEEIWSYLEPRGGEMPYTVFFGLQYLVKKYMAGVRITPDKIKEAHEENIAHFGFDCFNAAMWNHIWEKHGGRLPLEIRAVPEGTPVAVKNILMSIKNTDTEKDKCAALPNISETLLMKLWASNTVAAYVRIVKELMMRYHALSSDAPAWLIDFMHHDFGYRGVNSEESARILGAAAMTSFKGTDTMGALKLARNYYGERMAGFSVLASEHSVTCAAAQGKDGELEAYRTFIRNVKEKAKDFNPASGLIILSLVSDTYNIYRVCNYILPQLASEFIGWKNAHGIPLKIVVRPDSGDPESVLFGDKKVTEKNEIVQRMVSEYGETLINAMTMVEYGVFKILLNKFGSTLNSKKFQTLHPQIGVLQGDGVSLKTIGILYKRMMEENIDSMSLVFGSGGKLLQAHDRDEQKYAIKATHVIVNGKGVNIEKDPITDSGKRSKKGYLKLVRKQISNVPGEEWKNFVTLQSGDPGFEEAEDVLIPIFRNGEILKEFTFEEIRTNCAITPIPELVEA